MDGWIERRVDAGGCLSRKIKTSAMVSGSGCAARERRAEFRHFTTQGRVYLVAKKSPNIKSSPTI